MKKYIILLLFFICNKAGAQELFVSTDPASNMPAGSISFRVNSKVSYMNHDSKWSAIRVDPEIMLGINKNLMTHFSIYGSNMFQSGFRVEGGSVYGKYRFFSTDAVHQHFRIAAYGKLSIINNPVVLTKTHAHLIRDGNGGESIHNIPTNYRSYIIDQDGSTSGFGSGLIATKLKNRLAVSATAGYLYRLNNVKEKKEIFQPWHAVNWSLSAGYLLLPKKLVSYDQANLNLYLEFLGYNSLDARGSYIDVAPAVQFIFNSIARLDIGYQAQLTGKGERFHNSSVIVKLEYNFLNVF